LCAENKNFGLRFDVATASWKIITAPNIDLINAFALGKAGDTTNNNLDTSWIIAFAKESDEYQIRVRTLNYIFGSLEQNRFYFDVNQKIYDGKTGKTIKDQVRVLGINTTPRPSTLLPLKQDIVFEVDDSIKFEDGYQSSEEIQVAFSDSDDDGVIDNADAFEQIVGADTDLNYLFFTEVVDSFGNIIYAYFDNSTELILPRQSENQININDFNDGQLIYFYDKKSEGSELVYY
jgi:hypothetical protein